MAVPIGDAKSYFIERSPIMVSNVWRRFPYFIFVLVLLPLLLSSRTPWHLSFLIAALSAFVFYALVSATNDTMVSRVEFSEDKIIATADEALMQFDWTDLRSIELVSAAHSRFHFITRDGEKRSFLIPLFMPILPKGFGRHIHIDHGES